MKSLEEVYVATDGEKIFDAEGYTYSFSSSSLKDFGYSEEMAKNIADILNREAYPGLIKVAKVEIFAKITY